MSQARAEAVLVALQGRQVDVSGMRAVGYGEGVPVADNGDEAGREANRRIEFTLIEALAAKVTEGATRSLAPTGGVDFSKDDSPSVAPKEKTARPKARPTE